MLKAFLIRLWQHATQGFARPQANKQIDEADDFKKFYRNELIETARKLGYDIQLVKDEPEIDPMNTAVWVGSGAESSQLGTYVKRKDFKAISKGEWPNSPKPKDISALEQFENNPKLKEAYQKAVEVYRKETDR